MVFLVIGRMTKEQETLEDKDLYFSAEDSIFGKDFTHWIVKFWNTYRHPNFLRNRGPVYCLPGIIPEVEKKQRQTHFTIDRKKAILLSPMNFLHFTRENDKQTNKDYQKYLCRIRMDNIGLIDVALDGIDVSDKLVRVATGLFELDYKYVAASDGYWLFLKPNTLEKGRHTINSFGTCSSGATKVNTNFVLDIEDKDGDRKREGQASKEIFTFGND